MELAIARATHRKIAYVTPGCFDKGGISRYSRYQISALRNLFGAESVRAYSLLGADSSAFEEPFAVTWAGGRLSRATKMRLIARVAADVATWQPDVIHSAHINMSAMTHTLAKMVRARSVLNVYGLEVWSAPRKDAQWGLSHSDAVISDCHYTARHISDERMRMRPMTVIWDCVDTRRFFPAPTLEDTLAKYGIPDPATGINLLSLGRMTKDSAHKGYERLLEVFARVASKLPKLRLVFGGRGDMIASLRERAAALHLADRVHFLGSIDESDLANVYRTAHIFSLVSDRGHGRGEGIPLTPLEAAACGVPLLVGNHDGSQEAVVEGDNGFICDPFDLSAHADRITRLVSDTELRGRMARRAHQRITEHFTFERFTSEHAALYEQLQNGVAVAH